MNDRVRGSISKPSEAKVGYYLNPNVKKRADSREKTANFSIRMQVKTQKKAAI